MNGKFSRRSLLRGMSSGAAVLLFRQRLAFAQMGGPRVGPVGVELSLFEVNPQILRITVAANDVNLDGIYGDGSLTAKSWPKPILKAQTSSPAGPISWGKRKIEIGQEPFRITVREAEGRVRQELRFEESHASVSFLYGNGPVFGLGEGVHPLDRRGTRDGMRNGQAGGDLRTFGARVPIPWLIGADGWGLFFHEPWGSFDLTGETGIFRPEDSPRAKDIFLVLGETPAQLMRA
ncbi:MAG TPA: glycoside hydrolase family 31 protein, partial [Acidobacteriaceae bacterium]|nr:glycoside hydrolase family 31 protein [Acidobacteriaceae bacterium]